ncbi:hypothetical protein TEA_002313 [Camellia sinensis var. sinensis]|uniref:Hexosyltransferase n=1 Tax=Camellia sinensis var. sinensis TaxID=542762 RepID=A0A4S4DRJ9_CAMSN|nr:hypothetical protein TEA_002313 [Camellia sinensis var. sinensis]
MVYLENSSGLSLSNSNASTGENSRKTRQLTEESAEHLNTVSTTTNGTGDRHPEEKNPIRQVTEQGHKPGLTDQNENKEQENVKDKMGKVGVSEDTSTSTSNNAAVNLCVMVLLETITIPFEQFNLADARWCGISSLTIRIFLRELRLRMKEAQRSLGEAIKDSELPRNSVEKLKALEQTLAKGKQIQDDCTAMRNFPNQEKLEDPRLYHYALFTDNILAAAVVVNSTISHAKMNNSPTTGSVTTTVAEKQRLASLVLLSIIKNASKYDEFEVFDGLRQWGRASVEVVIADSTFQRWVCEVPSCGDDADCGNQEAENGACPQKFRKLLYFLEMITWA